MKEGGGGLVGPPLPLEPRALAMVVWQHFLAFVPLATQEGYGKHLLAQEFLPLRQKSLGCLQNFWEMHGDLGHDEQPLSYSWLYERDGGGGRRLIFL